jgi:hypothetical protein
MDLPPPLTRPLDLVLHLGTGKAGSSSIQYFLRDNRERLADRGILYPRSPGGARHVRLGLFAKPDAELVTSPEWPRMGQTAPAKFRNGFRRRLLGEIEQSGLSRVLLSDEVLFGSSAATLRRLARFTERIAERRRLVVYLRRQDEHMISRYQQGVKIGWVVRLQDWAREDMSDLYDYRARLGRHCRLFAPATLAVRRFEPSEFEGGSLVQDFLKAAGIEIPMRDLHVGADRNQSLDAETVEFLRLLNLYRVEHEGTTVGQVDNRELVRRLSAASTGPTLTLPEPFLDEFMETWEPSNRAVAVDFLGDPTRQLFRSPRRVRDTTIEQRLEPERLGHFMELTSVPEKMHQPLRALAEREARGTGR